ncbi:MAG TPA: double-strand break repair helicase AddA [Rhizomicrobium sp.]|jgi:ATP-dependent helicase/nuclease subunit A|nr:double-strand break repair helicase AddA [Rhizomicrobium sp.]
MSAGLSESARAGNPNISVWVSAHAGTGKTYTLANRVTRLLLDDAAPQKILCLTYTKAAAAEMAGRLFAQLGEWAMLDDATLTQKLADIGVEHRGETDLRRARRLFALALETPGGLKIQTIHSFCQYLLARFPLEAGIPPAFEVLDEATARELIGEARTHVFERAAEGEEKLAQAVACLATQADDGKLRALLDHSLGGDRRKFERYLDRFGGDSNAIDAAIAGAHGVEPDEQCEAIAARFCAKMEEERESLSNIAHWLARGSRKDRELANGLTAAVAGENAFEACCGMFLTTAAEPRRLLVSKTHADSDPVLHEQFREFVDKFLAVEQRCRAARAAALSSATVTIATAAHAEYARLKTERGVLDYEDLIANTLRLLERSGAASWVLYKLDGGIDHILIDEAQDTSPEQWRIIRRLSEEFFAGGAADEAHTRTLFVVGDEKQSIFSFQGADPAQFAINRREFESRAGDVFASVDLTESRRSARGILDFVDAVFADDAVRDGVSSAPIRHQTARRDAPARVVLWPAIKPIEAPKHDVWDAPVDVEPSWSPVVRLAQAIADRIRSWIDGQTFLPGHHKPITPADIMVLMPRREPFASELIRQLKQRSVPVAGADRIRLLDQIAIMDLVALGRFALLPEDDLNLAALLRSPLVGFSEDELHALAAGREGSIWRALVERREELPVFAFAYECLHEARNRADFMPPYEYFAHVLGPGGGRKRLLARLGAEANDAIDEFLALALVHERLNTPSLEGFLYWLQSGEAEIKRDMERGRNEVRVMTVHGAKGLEADIVIVPDATSIPQGASRHGAMLYDNDGAYFPLSNTQAPDCVRAAKLRADEEALREHRRLLYVALTRARDELHICAFENSKPIPKGSWYDVMRPVADRLGLTLNEDEDFVREATAPVAMHEHEKTAALILPDWARHPAPQEEERSRFIRPSLALDEEPPTRHAPRRGPRFARGLLVHALLARLPNVAPGDRERAARRYLAARDVAESDADALIRETTAILDNPDFAEAFAVGSRAEADVVAELPELGAGARINGRVDRLAVTDHAVLVVDFKSNRTPPGTAREVAPIYLAQMALYRVALAKIFPSREIKCALIWTEVPLLMPLPLALLDAALERIKARLDPAGTRS